MSQRIVSLLLIGLIVFTTGATRADEWTPPKNANDKKNPVSSDEKSIAAGKKIYQRECTQCHGAGGKGDGEKAKELKKHPGDLPKQLPGQTDGAVYWKITVGKQPMPSYIGKLTEEQRWQVVNYLRTFAQAEKSAGTAVTTPSDEKTTAAK